MSPMTIYHLVAIFLLCLGLFGIMYRRTLVGMILGIELMLNGAGLSIMASAQLTPTPNEIGQIGTLLVMGIAAAEATLLLAILLVVSKRFKSVEAAKLTTMRG
ncbi:NADH-quinone oxidoreductase subunit NuoK [Desulfonatronovibrio hydrogenovorans]|uniref:NADH-quinone oxidoreductase subunit NuoK n=1 Tax=Desulfonatronovibrio hydrogenovorans TaxID=53245 RepID=UPI00048D3057|nr:NADH-quinone oxidoreductase subunit NuoK [Desulfonatronovibrio hydrogenovorans]